MRSRLADYQLLGPADADGEGRRTWLAQPPDRLHEAGPVVVTELDAASEAAWAVIVERLAGLAQVRSDHLPRLLEAGRSDEDGDLVAWVSRSQGTTMSPVAAGSGAAGTLRVLAGAARGAHDLHEAGWAHGDIATSAILVDDDRGLLEPPVRRQTLIGPTAQRVRTPMDLDPIEADALWGQGPTRASDIFALGAAAHVLLTGRWLHPALATDQVVTAVQRVLIEPPALDPSLPPAAAEVVAACLAPDPANRPSSAADLAERLDAAAAKL